jgi:hypothetical protein
LTHLPKHKTVVLGLISSKLPQLEDPNQIAGRIDEAARILGDPEKKRICLSPQCGFASHIEGNNVSPRAAQLTAGYRTGCGEEIEISSGYCASDLVGCVKGCVASPWLNSVDWRCAGVWESFNKDI